MLFDLQKYSFWKQESHFKFVSIFLGQVLRTNLSAKYIATKEMQLAVTFL